MWGGEKKKRKKERKKKRTGFLSYRKINTAPAIFAGIPLFLSDSAPLIGHGCPERATPAVSNHRLKADGAGECRVVADGKRGWGGGAKADFFHGWILAEAQGKINIDEHRRR